MAQYTYFFVFLISRQLLSLSILFLADDTQIKWLILNCNPSNGGLAIGSEISGDVRNNGQDLLLLGGSVQDNLFQIPDLEAHLDLLGGKWLPPVSLDIRND